MEVIPKVRITPKQIHIKTVIITWTSAIPLLQNLQIDQLISASAVLADRSHCSRLDCIVVCIVLVSCNLLVL